MVTRKVIKDSTNVTAILPVTLAAPGSKPIKLFINIKVDREERPDIDFVFQSSFQLFNRSSGGWPLTMFLDEDGVPFMGGTYFPKESKNGLPSFKEVLQKVSEAYNGQREEILKQKKIIKN